MKASLLLQFCEWVSRYQTASIYESVSKIINEVNGVLHFVFVIIAVVLNEKEKWKFFSYKADDNSPSQ
jgi:hypothetical protein